MRSLVVALLANLPICSASSSSAPAESKARALPKLEQDLTVVRQPASPGEPIALVGRQTMMCAIRQDAPTACIGEIGLALEPKDPAAIVPGMPLGTKVPRAAGSMPSAQPSPSAP